MAGHPLWPAIPIYGLVVSSDHPIAHTTNNLDQQLVLLWITLISGKGLLLVRYPHLVHHHAIRVWMEIAVKLDGIGELVV